MGVTDFDLQMRTKAEEDPVVAAASVVARAEYVRQMHALSREFGGPLQKGAGPLVKEQAPRSSSGSGPGRSATFAKLHFRTAYEVVSAAGKLGRAAAAGAAGEDGVGRLRAARGSDAEAPTAPQLRPEEDRGLREPDRRRRGGARRPGRAGRGRRGPRDPRLPRGPLGGGEGRPGQRLEAPHRRRARGALGRVRGASPPRGSSTPTSARRASRRSSSTTSSARPSSPCGARWRASTRRPRSAAHAGARPLLLASRRGTPSCPVVSCRVLVDGLPLRGFPYPHPRS